jgi:hypothetical protein
MYESLCMILSHLDSYWQNSALSCHTAVPHFLSVVNHDELGKVSIASLSDQTCNLSPAQWTTTTKDTLLSLSATSSAFSLKKKCLGVLSV